MATGSEKRTHWWNHDVKEAIQTKKDDFKALLPNRSSSDLQFQYSETQNVAAPAVKMFKERSCAEFEFQLFIGKQNILAEHLPLTWEKFKYHRHKQDSTGSIIRDEKEIPSQ